MSYSTAFHNFCETAFPILGDASVKAFALLAFTALFARLLGRASAAVRHRLWFLALCGTISLPILSLLLPQWRIPLLPATDSASIDRSWPSVPNGANSTASIGERSTGHRSTLAESDSVARRRPREAVGPVSLDDSPPLPTDQNAPWHRSVALREWLVAGWLAGCALIGVPLVCGMVSTARRYRRFAIVEDPRRIHMLNELAAQLGLRRSVILCETNQGLVPMTWGILRPVILMPHASQGWTDARWRMVLLHELFHIKRFDTLVQTFARWICALYWFHPLTWHALLRLRIEREMACDDCVVEAGERPTDYAAQLLEIAGSYRCNLGIALAVAMTRTTLVECRIVSLLDRNRSHQSLGRYGSVRVVITISALVLALSAVGLAERAEHASSPVHLTSTTADEPAATKQAPRDEASDLAKLRLTFRQELAQEETLEAVERVAHGLTQRFTRPAEIALLRAETADRLARMRNPSATIVWTQAALQSPLSPVDRIRMYQLWSNAAREKYPQQLTPEAGFHTFTPLILGLLEAARQDVPLNGKRVETGDKELGQMMELRDELAWQITKLIVDQNTSEFARGFEYFQQFARKPVLLEMSEPVPRPAWLPTEVAFSQNVRMDPVQWFESFRRIVDVIADDGVFEDVLHSLEHDPQGPQVNYRREIAGTLGKQLFVAADYSQPPAPRHRLLLAIETTDSRRLAQTLAKTFLREPNFKHRSRGKYDVWEGFDDRGKVTLAIGVAHGYLLATHDRELLDKVLDFEPKP